MRGSEGLEGGGGGVGMMCLFDGMGFWGAK